MVVSKDVEVVELRGKVGFLEGGEVAASLSESHGMVHSSSCPE